MKFRLVTAEPIANNTGDNNKKNKYKMSIFLFKAFINMG